MSPGRFRTLGIAGVLLTLVFSLISLQARYRVESRNKAVELAVELETVEALAAAQGLRLEEGVSKLKAAGVGAAVLSEQKVGELIDDGVLDLVPDGEGPTSTLEGSSRAMKRVARGLATRAGRLDWDSRTAAGLLELSDRSPALIRSVAVGLNPRLLQAAKDANLRIIARGDNPTGASAETVKGTLEWFKEDGASIFLPQGDQVLGRRDNRAAFVEALNDTGLLYASPEFTKLGGDQNVLAEAPEKVVRLHSAQSAELDKMPEGDAVDRYVRAASERSMRVLLIRPLTLSSPQPLDSFADFVGKIRKKLANEGHPLGPAKPFVAPEVPRWVFPLIGASAAMVLVYAASLFVGSSTIIGLIGLIGLIIGGGAYFEGLRNYAALMAAFTFPVAAYGFLESFRHRIIPIHLLVMVAVSFVGGLAVAGLLNDLPYYIRAEQFAGVKLAHFGPILAVGLFMAMRLIDWKGGLQSPVSWLQAFLAVFVLAALGFMFMRTGNDNPSAVSGVEMRLRSLLENVLPVRPRTKEFVIGYPALIVGLGLLMVVREKRVAAVGPSAESGAPPLGGDGPSGAEAQSEAQSSSGESSSGSLRGWAVLSLMVGAVALTSVVNTMCHLHTPLSVGVVRIAVGLVLGGIIGGGVWAVLRYGLLRART